MNLSDLSPEYQRQAEKQLAQPAKRTTRKGQPKAACLTAGRCRCGQPFPSIEKWESEHCTAGHARFDLELPTKEKAE